MPERSTCFEAFLQPRRRGRSLDNPQCFPILQNVLREGVAKLNKQSSKGSSRQVARSRGRDVDQRVLQWAIFCDKAGLAKKLTDRAIEAEVHKDAAAVALLRQLWVD